MRRFFDVNFDIKEGQLLFFNMTQDAHHLIHVLRVRKGDLFELANGRGLIAKVQVTAITKKELQVCVLEFQQVKRKPYQIILACAIPKKAKFETIIEKAVELGVDVIIPMVTQRTESVGSKQQWLKKDERFLKISIEAMKQTRRPFLPEVLPIMSFKEAVEYFQAQEHTKVFIPWLEEQTIAQRHSLSMYLKQENQKGSLAFLIGPEGDFTLEEVSLAQQHSAVPVSLGENVLKVDTACFYCLSLAQASFHS